MEQALSSDPFRKWPANTGYLKSDYESDYSSVLKSCS